jgi:hypothetical protein
MKDRGKATGAALEPAEPGLMSRSPLDLLFEDAVRDSFETFRDVMPTAMLFPKKGPLRRYALSQAIKALGTDRLFLEFGVWRGHSINSFARDLAQHGAAITGFDSFEGLEEDWSGHHRGREKGGFSLDGEKPRVLRNVRLVKGWVQDTVPPFLAAHPKAPVTFAHLDLDTYTPTAFVMAQIKDRLVVGSVLLFDELYGYPGWRHHEYKALQEVLGKDCYRFIGFSEQAAAIQITQAP